MVFDLFLYIFRRCPLVRGAFHSQKISYTFGKNPFVFKKNPSKIRVNPFVLKKSCTLFTMSEVPLALVILSFSLKNMFGSMSIYPLKILNVKTISPRERLYTSVGRSRERKRSSYGRSFIARINFVALLCTLSRDLSVSIYKDSRLNPLTRVLDELNFCKAV